MKRQYIGWVVILLGWYAATIYYLEPPETEVSDSPSSVDPSLLAIKLPDFAAIPEVGQKKQRFFDYLEPFIEHQNQLLANKRTRLKALQGVDLDEGDRQWVEELLVRYRVKAKLEGDTVVSDAVLNNLLLRIDQIPPSLVLAQAANESAWGTSRFARVANNLFGQWCFKPGCGVVPSSRPEGEIYEVKRFESVGGSVAGYFHNINSQPSYHNLRELRRSFRLVGKGHEAGEWLAEGLRSYSSRGEEYVREIQSMIRSNELSAYDTNVLGARVDVDPQVDSGAG